MLKEIRKLQILLMKSHLMSSVLHGAEAVLITCYSTRANEFVNDTTFNNDERFI